jgi:hypothetical protein
MVVADAALASQMGERKEPGSSLRIQALPCRDALQGQKAPAVLLGRGDRGRVGHARGSRGRHAELLHQLW